MEEIIQLLKENNIMLRYICENIISKEQTQDSRDIMNNIVGDMLAEYLIKKK